MNTYIIGGVHFEFYARWPPEIDHNLFAMVFETVMPIPTTVPNLKTWHQGHDLTYFCIYSCPANRKQIPERLRSCERVDEVKRLRDLIEMHRLNNMTEVTLMRNKQLLFKEYCKFKNTFVTSSASESNDLKIQEEILDETWAKWIQNYKTMDQELNHDKMVHICVKL